MAIITHGTALPDSSGKDDFYAAIDNGTVTGIVNADCAAGMALVDTKLATIATAGKVNTSALTTTSAAQGDVLYHDGSSWTRLGQSTSGYVLTTKGAAANPEWAINPANSNNVVKGWIQFNGTGTIAIVDSFNVTSITDNNAGDYTITWDTDFANDDYCCVGTAVCVAGSATSVLGIDVIATGTVTVNVVNPSDASGIDKAIVMVMAIGDQ